MEVFSIQQLIALRAMKHQAKACLGVIMLDTRFPRPPGDIGSPATWARAGIPVRFVTVPGSTARRVVQTQDPALLGPAVDAARSLALQSARLITTSCGFLAGWLAGRIAGGGGRARDHLQPVAV